MSIIKVGDRFQHRTSPITTIVTCVLAVCDSMTTNKYFLGGASAPISADQLDADYYKLSDELQQSGEIESLITRLKETQAKIVINRNELQELLDDVESLSGHMDDTEFNTREAIRSLQNAYDDMAKLQ